MDKHHWIFIYIIGFVFLAVLLNAFEIVNIKNAEILSYALAFYGLGLVYISFGTSRRGSLFLGTIVFLIGIIVFIMNNFTFDDDSRIIIPSVFLILGTGFLMLFFDDFTHRVTLYVSLVFMLLGVAFTFLSGSFGVLSFFTAVPQIVIKILPLILIGIVLLILLRGRKGL